MWLLFYKRIKTVGGAEVLLSQHYLWLKERNENVKVVCFETASPDRVLIDSSDLIVLQDRGVLKKIRSLIEILKANKAVRVICHSGYLELGIASLIAKVPYSIFVHQPTSMSFNEQDKFSLRFWGRYKKFAIKDDMFRKICEQRNELSILRCFYIELRTFVSQIILRRAKVLFVLSHYASREKLNIFGLKTVVLAGAISKENAKVIAERKDTYHKNDLINLVTVSRIDENKRIDILIKAVSRLIKRGFRVNLKIRGDGPSLDNLKKLASDYGIADSIEFLGFVPEIDIPLLYDGMDLFVTIDWADYRITTYEVLSKNRRVIVSDDTDADPELIKSGYLLTSAPRAGALSETIILALNKKVLWNNSELSEYLLSYSWPVYFESITKIVDVKNS